MTSDAAAAAAEPTLNNTRAILILALGSASISTMHVIARWLSEEVHPFEIAFFRNIVVFVLILPLVLRKGGGGFRTKRLGLNLLRGVFGICAMLTWFYALSITPVAEATAISFSQVIFTTLGAVLLGDRLGWRRGLAVLAGFLGTLIILRPGLGVFSAGGVVVIVSTVFWAASLLCTKVLTRTDKPAFVVLFATAFFIPTSALAASFFWTWPTVEQLLVMGLIGLLAAVSHMCIAEALRIGEATAVMPIDFSRLLFAAVIGYFWLGEFPDLWTWVGAAVIIAAAVYITIREARQKKAAPAQPAPDNAAL